VLRSRVDTMMGVEFSRTGTNFYWILAQHVIEPLVTTTRSYAFDARTFDRVYRDFEAKFRAEHLHMIEFRALNGFESAEDPFLLPDGLVLQRMSDSQVSTAIDVGAVPRMASGAGVNTAHVHRYDQWALMDAEEFPVTAGDLQIATPRPPAFPRLDEQATRLVTALRLVCGGSVVTTRSMYAQDDEEFPFVHPGTAALGAFTGADNNRPTILSPATADTLRRAYTALGSFSVLADRSLQVAIRRLVYAGSRSLDSDRLIDLMTSAEALFIKRANAKTKAKGAPVAQAAATLLAADPELNADAAKLEAFMAMAYKARNAEVHGEPQPYAPLHRLSGQPVTSLSLVVADAEHVMRRALMAVLEGQAAQPTT
jgi:hypothetical protein